MLKILLYVLFVFTANAEETLDTNPDLSNDKQNICIQKKQEIENVYNIELKNSLEQLDIDKKFIDREFNNATSSFILQKKRYRLTTDAYNKGINAARLQYNSKIQIAQNIYDNALLSANNKKIDSINKLKEIDCE